MTLTAEQSRVLQEIGRAHDLRFIILHGSYAKGNPHQGSDLDIAIVGRRRIAFDEVLKIHGELSDVFGDNRERELDLKILHGVDPLFRYFVVRDGILLFGNSTEYNEFKAYAFREFVDSAGLRRLELVVTQAKQRMLSERYREWDSSPIGIHA